MRGTICFTFADITEYRGSQKSLERELGAVLGQEAGGFMIGVNEAITNAFEYGPSGVVVCIHVIKAEWLVVRIKDFGKGFNWQAKLQELRNKTAGIDLTILSERGHGISVMQKTADRLCFNKKGNEVLVAKRIAVGKRD